MSIGVGKVVFANQKTETECLSITIYDSEPPIKLISSMGSINSKNLK